jgi:hypothetical protein
MAIPQDAMARGRVGVEVVGALGVVGLAVAALALRPSRRPNAREHGDASRSALAAYLREHLSGADAAIQVVERLKEAHRGTREGTLFATLDQEFRDDRGVVAALLRDLHASPRSAKRLMGQAAGSVLKLAAGGERGELRLFRTLEMLAIGVQGKRCMWRAAQALEPRLQPRGARSFAELEARALDQWEAIERCRRLLVPRTFAV